jgi:predicted PurR-regulated permease PerM
MAAPERSKATWRDLDARDLYKLAAILAAAAVLLIFFRELFEVALAFYAAIIIAVTWNPVVERLPMPRWLGAVSVLLLSLLVLAGLVAALSGPLLAQIEELREAIPEMIDVAREQLAPVAGAVGLDLEGLELAGENGQGVLGALGSVAGYAFLVFVIFLGALYMLAKPHEQLLDPVLRLFPAERRKLVRTMVLDLTPQLRRFVLAEAIAIALVSTVATLLLSIIGVPFPLALGVLMGLGELVPYLGPVFTLIPALIVAFIEEPIMAAWVLLAWTGIQAVQSQVVWPLLVHGTVKLHPVWVVFGVVFFGRLFGPLGVLLAVPLLSLAGILIHYMWIERKVATAEDRIAPMVRKPL